MKRIASVLSGLVLLAVSAPVSAGSHAWSYLPSTDPRVYTKPNYYNPIHPMPSNVQQMPWTQPRQQRIITAPFFCDVCHAGFPNEAAFVDHVHNHHNIAFEVIPSVVVRVGGTIFFAE